MEIINNKLAVFIMVHGRPEKMWTYNTLRKQGSLLCVMIIQVLNTGIMEI